VRIILWVLLVGACSYHAGSFADWTGRFPGEQLTIGCIDLAVGPAFDVHAEGPVIAYGFGNHCTHAVTLDLASVRVIGRDADGTERTLRAFDPAYEIRPLPLDALWAGRERIAYVDPHAESLISVCVDVGGVDASVARTERWVCNSQRGPELAP
jgi:hypothetical protein